MVAAVLGREFSFALLAAVSPLDEPALAEGLERLVRAGLLFVRGAPPAASYMFKHSLIQDTAYQSLLKSKRQELHARVARALEERFPERAEIEAEIIARHYEEAGLSERAVAYYQRAGDRATKRSANAEAIRHLSKGIELIRESHDSPQRAQQEAILQVMLGAPLQAVKGFGDPAVEAAYGRARALCQEIGNAPQLFQALFGLTAFYQTRGDLGVAHEIGQQLLALAQQTGDPALLLLGHMTVGNPLYWLGRSPEALEHLNQTIALYDPAQHRALAYAYGQEPGVVARTFAALALWNIGRHEQALRRGAEAVRLARESRHALSLAFALGFAGTLHWFRREPERVAACAGELIALSTEQNFPLWLGVGLVQHGWARFAADDRGGSDELHRGLAQLATTGAQIGSKQVMGMLAEIYAADGRANDALAILDAAAASRADAFYDAELQRLKGEIILQRDGTAEREAAALFRRAGEIARAQRATSFELRASVSLSRLLGRQGRAREARTVLSDVYGRFTEGHETPDLRDAATLLASLS